MAVKFLSDDWAQAVSNNLNSHEAFRTAIQNTKLDLQFLIGEVPERDEIHYYVSLDRGRAMVERGELPNPDVTVSNTYETAAEISKGELDVQTAFITGRLKVQGNLAALMMNQAALTHFANAAAGLEVEY